MLVLFLSLLLTDAKPVTVPFELLKTRHMTVQVKLNGKGPYRFLFDTGAPLTIVSQQAARDTGLTAGLGTSRTQVRSLELGELKAENAPVVIVDHPAVTALSRAAGPIHGIIGFPFFARYRMTLDYQAQRLTFVPSGYEPADILQTLLDIVTRSSKAAPTILVPAGQWGLVVDRDAADEAPGVTIRAVLAGSAAAEAGLKPGDRLRTIDGRWTDSIADCYRAAGHVSPGQSAPVVVHRDGKELTLAVKPRSGL